MRNALVTLLVVAVIPLAGCSTKIRNITAQSWSHQGIYVGYWEGTCRAMLGCDAGDGKVTFCDLKDDNSLTCTEQAEVSKLLARKQPK